MLEHHWPKWVITCPHAVQARITTTLCTSKFEHNTQKQQMFEWKLHSWWTGTSLP